MELCGVVDTNTLLIFTLPAVGRELPAFLHLKISLRTSGKIIIATTTALRKQKKKHMNEMK